MVVKEKIIKFIKTKLLKDESLKDFGDEDSLITSGIIDSLGIIALVNFIEKELSIKVLDEDIVVENFQNINSIVSYIENKLSVNLNK